MRIAVVALAVVITIGVTRSIASAQLSAEELYIQGQAAYDDEDYRAAVDLWERSYKLSGQALLILNIAQAHRLAGHCALALATYRQFITVDPTSEQRPLADDFVRELEPRCGASAPTLLPLTPSLPIVDAAPPKPGRSLKIAGLATGSAGVLTLAVGLGFGHHASSLGDEVTRACSVSCDWASLRDKDASGRRYATIGHALDVLGAAAIIGGGIMYVVGDRRSAITVAPRSREGGATVTWSGSW